MSDPKDEHENPVQSFVYLTQEEQAEIDANEPERGPIDQNQMDLLA